ncbi:MAG: pyridoxal phosphate-dependent aminotransferase, partial [Pyrinomonadaceae bacterium]
INGGRVIDVPLTSDFKFDVPGILKTIEVEQPEVIFICSPNNPTGGMIDEKDLLKVLIAAPGIVVVDEAYYEFSGYTAVPLLSKFENLVVLHTFSKAIGMAGLRIGYLMTSPDMAREINKVILPYNLNVFSRIAAETALEFYETEVKPQIHLILKERDRVFARLREITGVDPVPTTTNFILCRLALEPKLVFDKLKASDVLVRDVSAAPALKDCLRFSIGTPKENDRLVTTLEEIFSVAEQYAGRKGGS